MLTPTTHTTLLSRQSRRAIEVSESDINAGIPRRSRGKMPLLVVLTLCCFNLHESVPNMMKDIVFSGTDSVKPLVSI